MERGSEITELLRASQAGNAEALEGLIGEVYPVLRNLAAKELRKERKGHTLQPTALVNEAFLRLFHGTRCEWEDRNHFFRVAARQMRRILISHARKRLSGKRGGDIQRVPLLETSAVVTLDMEALVGVDRELERLASVDPRVGDVVELRLFGGLSEAETAQVLEISETTVAREWKFGRTWLYDRLRPGSETD